MNVLQVVESCNAGVGRHVRGLCKGLVSHGHRVAVAYSPRRMDPAFQEFVRDGQNGVRFVPLEVGRKVSPVSDLRSVLRLARLVRAESPPFDVAHGHSSKGGALARITGRLASVPTVYTPHSLVMASPEISGLRGLFYTLVERALGRGATLRLIAVSQDERDLVLKLGLVSQERVVVIENGIDDEDFEQFSQNSIREDDKPLIFGAAMRFSAQKAPDQLVAAFIRLREELPQLPTRLVIAGDGELFTEVERQIKASGLESEISLLGWTTDTRELLRSFDVFLLSSLCEGFSYGVLEAMAAKLPVVTTDVFGTRETVARVPGNVIVPVGDSDALALGMKRMATLALPKELRQALHRIGQANHDYARARFRQSEITRRTLEVYRALC